MLYEPGRPVKTHTSLRSLACLLFAHEVFYANLDLYPNSTATYTHEPLENGEHGTCKYRNHMGRLIYQLFQFFECWILFLGFYFICRYHSKLTFQKHLSNIPSVCQQIGSKSGPTKKLFVGPHLDPNCFQRLSANDKTRHLQAKGKDLDFSMSRLFIL